MGKEFHYDAFISYRHCELDSFVAQNLHRQMEAFKLPANLAKADHLTRNKITRVFRDREELPISINLADNITEALHTSEFLIVICTPRLKDSMWCRKEIETFIELHGRDKVLAVLAEGEPSESYPPELLYRDVEVTNEDGTTSIVREDIEPLGADMRGANNKEVLKAIKAELPRLLAPMFGTSYDGLRQRHREQKLRKIIGASVLAGLVGIAFGTVSTLMMLQISQQKQQIESQNVEIVAQNAEIVEQNAEIKEQAEEIKEQNDSLLLSQAKTLAETSERQLQNGDRVGAIRTALDCLTNHKGLIMPYTEEGELALADSIRAYDRDSTMYPVYQIHLKGTVEWTASLYKGRHILVYDSAKVLSLIDIPHGKTVKRIMDAYDGSQPCAALRDEENFYYINRDYELIAAKVEGDEQRTVALDFKPYFLNISPDGSILIASDNHHVAAIDTATEQILGSFDTGEYYQQHNGEFHQVGDDVYFAVSAYALMDEGSEMYVMNTTDGVTRKFDLKNKTVKQMVFDGEDLICASTLYRNRNTEYDGIITRYRMSDGSVVWEKTYENNSATSIVKSLGDKDQIVVGLSWAAVLMDMKTGQEISNLPMGDSIIGLYGVNDANLFIALTRSGRRLIVNGDSGDLIDLVSSFRSHSDNLKGSDQVYGGFMVSAYKENAITMYGYLAYGEAVEEVTLDVAPAEYMSAYEAVPYAEEKGFESPELVSKVFFSEDEKLTFVVYFDDSLRIYNTADSMLLGEVYDDVASFQQFLGYDKDGNYFVGYRGEAIKLSPNHKVIARMPHFYDYEAETNMLRFRTTSGQFLVPNYTTKELLEMANEIMVEYTE